MCEHGCTSVSVCMCECECECVFVHASLQYIIQPVHTL